MLTRFCCSVTLALGLLTLAGGQSLQAETPREVYEAKIRQMDQELGAQLNDLRQEYKRLATQYKQAPENSDQRKALQAETTRIKEQMTSLKARMAQARKEADQTYQAARKEIADKKAANKDDKEKKADGEPQDNAKKAERRKR